MCDPLAGLIAQYEDQQLRVDDVRIVTCDICGGWGWLAAWDKSCPKCDGKGKVEVRVEPVTMEDLEEAHGGDHR